MGCNKNELKEIDFYAEQTPLYLENKIFTKEKLDEIYNIYNGNSEINLYDYIKDDINKYRLLKYEDSYFYTCVLIEDFAVLYIIFEDCYCEYKAVEMAVKDIDSNYLKDAFKSFELGKTTLDEIKVFDKWTKYNTYETSAFGPVTTHFIGDNGIAVIHYDMNFSVTIAEIDYSLRGFSSKLISRVEDVDWILINK